ncbi:MAG TPA: metallophosphoesterase [Gaiellaceae bacterium]|nr:metallophosphoesterase [Gaiellaceae bacterium]
MVTRILHVSDLHVGARTDSLLEHALDSLIARAGPELVIASGDLTHRGRRDQHDRAAAFLRRLDLPVVAIPGNHDIPYTFPARFTHPWREFERHWQTTEPLHATDALHVVGVNSVRPWRHQSGGVSGSQLDRVAERLAQARPGSLRVVVLHHQLIGAPWRTRKKPVAKRNTVLARLVDSGAELILGGHIHQATVSERHEFEVIAGDARGVVVSVAPGLGQPRPKRRGEARGCVVYRGDDVSITVETSIWQDGDWVLTAVRRFPRGREPLAVLESAV